MENIKKIEKIKRIFKLSIDKCIKVWYYITIIKKEV